MNELTVAEGGDGREISQVNSHVIASQMPASLKNAYGNDRRIISMVYGERGST
jgi:hypothetical protein